MFYNNICINYKSLECYYKALVGLNKEHGKVDKHKKLARQDMKVVRLID